MEVLGDTTLLAYVDDIVILGESKTELERTIRKLIETSRKMGLKINKNKTKYMLMGRHPLPLQSLCMDNFLLNKLKILNT